MERTMQQISKKARSETLNALKDVALSLWDNQVGPLENLFGLFAHLVPFLPGLGWAVWLVERVATAFGYGMNDLGRWLDGELGFGPRSDVTVDTFDRGVGSGIRKLFLKEAGNIKGDSFQKNASASLLLRGLLSKLPFVTKWLWRGVRMILTAAGVEKVKDMYDAKNLMQQVVPKNLVNTQIESEEQDEKEEETGFDAEKMMNFLKNPMKTLQPVVNQYSNILKQQGADMSWEKSETMREFLKVAEETGLLKTAAPSPNPNKEDDKVVKEKRQKSPEKNIIDEAHPESVYIAEARGDGGLVENANEQQKKLIEMINKMPTGSLVGRYAMAAQELVKMANTLDEAGQSETADVLTEAADKLLEMAGELPFDKAPAKD